MSLITNVDTGLLEEPGYYRGLPRVYHRSLQHLKFRTRLKAAHSVPLPNGASLDFLSRLKRGDTLVVVFHGAIAEERLYYPRFERDLSIQKFEVPSLHFADPTLNLSKDQVMRLAWYLGGPGWDPQLQIANVVRQAMRQIGAKYVAFVGGSGGGFASLRISSLFPGSLAFVQDPQTSVMRYYPGAIKRYFACAWQGYDRNRVVNAFPERFDLNVLYENQSPPNFVYYYQSSSDDFHRRGHYNAFLKAIGGTVGGASFENARNRLVLADGKIPGHGKITPTEFEAHYLDAISWWSKQRQSIV